MTERRGDQGFSVAPRRIGEPPDGRRRRRISRPGVIVVGAIAVGLIAIGAIGPRLASRPNFDVSFFATPTPDPSRTAEPTPTDTPFGTPAPTPLPAVSRPDGATLSGRIVYQTYGLHSIDLATGDVIDGADVEPGRDALVRSPDGDGWVCVCFEDADVFDETTAHHTRSVVLRRVSATGTEVAATTVGHFDAALPAEGIPYDLTTDVDPFNSGRGGLIALGSRSGGPWRISIATVDLRLQTMSRVQDLARALQPPALPAPTPLASAPPSDPIPEPSPAPESYLDGPHVRVAPDGRYAFVWVVIQSQDQNGNSAMVVRAWRIGLGADGSIGDVTDAPGLAGIPAFCGSLGFAAADRAAFLCPNFLFNRADGGPGWTFGTVGPGGEDAGSVALSPADNGFYTEPLYDRANGLVYLWDAMNLEMTRVDVHTLEVETTTIDQGARTTPGIAARGDKPPVWGDADSGIDQFGFGQIAGAPDGSRIYALAFAPQVSFDGGNPASRGVFAFDRSTLALTDRWAPAANYFTVAATADGHVVAGGNPGFDESGREAPWDASLTIYDASDGRLLARFGRLGEDGTPFIVGP